MAVDAPLPQDAPPPSASGESASPRWPPPWERRVLGKRVPDVEGPDRVTGRTRHTGDVRMPGLLHGAVLRSPFAHATLLSLGLSEAAKAPGVRATAAVASPGSELRFAGQAVAAVAAEDVESARAALRHIDARYEPLPFTLNAPGETGEPSGTQGQGDVDAAFRSPAATVEAEYATTPLAPASPEPATAIAHWEAPDRLKVWASTAAIYALRAGLAGSLGLGASQVEVCCEHASLGGAPVVDLLPAAVAAAQLSRAAGAPVRIALDREDDLAASGTRPGVSGSVKAAADSDGKLLAVHVRARILSGGTGTPPPALRLPHLHACPASRLEWTLARANLPDAGEPAESWLPGAGFLVESAIDELAQAAGLNPVELRKRNEPDEERRRMYDLGAERIRWEQRNHVPGAGTGVTRRGMGVAACAWRDTGSPGTLVCVTLHRDGSIDVACGSGDLPAGVRTTLACVAAEVLGVAPNGVTVTLGRTSLGPGPTGAGALSPASMIPAVQAAVADARGQLLARVAPSLRAGAGDMGTGAGKVYVREDPDCSLTWRQACAKLPPEGIYGLGQWSEGPAGGDGAGIHFAEVDVDVETGSVSVARVVAVYDCGVVVNALGTQARIEGGILAGIGQALREERVWDPRHGIPLGSGVCALPGTMETPAIEVLFLERPEARSAVDPGDAPLMATAAAIGSALYNATGVRVRALPMTRERVLAALSKRPTAAPPLDRESAS